MISQASTSGLPYSYIAYRLKILRYRHYDNFPVTSCPDLGLIVICLYNKQVLLWQLTPLYGLIICVKLTVYFSIGNNNGNSVFEAKTFKVCVRHCLSKIKQTCKKYSV